MSSAIQPPVQFADIGECPDRFRNTLRDMLSSRISGFEIHQYHRFNVLKLEVNTGHGVDHFPVFFPPEYEGKIVAFAGKMAPN